jgi:RimJ/RimL family protein N-acetyltransferase
MPWQITDDAEAFLAAAGELLRARPIENTVFLTVAGAERKRHTPGAVFGWHAEAGVFLSTPPRQPCMSAMSAGAARELAQALAGTAFTEEWQRLTGTAARVRQRMRLHRLQALVPPASMPPGAARRVLETDRALIVEWVDAFYREVGEMDASAERFADERLRNRTLFLWEDRGEPVSMASMSVPDAGMIRIQAVFTPKPHRGRGYAAAVTVATVEWARQAGATEVVLYTDLANPTSNALYKRLGFEPVQDRTTVKFGA